MSQSVKIPQSASRFSFCTLLQQKIFRKTISLLILLPVAMALYAQDNTLYMMRNIHHTNILNPAFQDNYSVFIGIPGISSLRCNLELRDFNPSDVIFSTNDLGSALKDANRIDFDLFENIISLGFITGKSGLTFDFSQKMSYEFSVPGDAFVLWRNGNIDYIGKNMNFSGMKLSMNWYLEYALGYSYKYNSKWTFGVKAKYLNGIMNITTKKWETTLYTAPDSFDITLNTDIQLQVSAPIYVTYNTTGDSTEIDKIDMIKHNTGSILNNYVYYNKNRGLGFDFGAVYNLSSRLTLSASLIDLGFINWRNNIYELSNSSNYEFHGIILDYDNAGDTMTDNGQSIIDTVKALSKLHGINKNYTSSLTPKLHLGASYHFFRWLDLGALSRTVFYETGTTTSLTFSGNIEMWKFLTGSVSYTLINYSPVNLGIGLGLKAGPLQLYFITDSMFGWRYDNNHDIVWPAYTRDFGFRFGLNLMFGRTTDPDKQNIPKNTRHTID